MLRNLQVRNFAIVDQLEIEFFEGMTVLTGETGAGKSILVDALGLLLGDRGGAGLVRSGAERAELTAEFDVSGHEGAKMWLSDQALELEDACLIRRVIGADGRSRAFINGTAVPLNNLKAFGELMADIHGQHFHQSLGKPAVQRDLLDHYASATKLRQQTAAAFAAWRSADDELRSLEAQEADRASRVELLTFQLDELRSLNLAEREYDALVAENTKQKNLTKLATGLNAVLEGLDDGMDANARQLVAQAAVKLTELTDIDDGLKPAERMLDEAAIHIDEAVDQVRRYAESLDADPERVAWVEERIDAARTIARKHQREPDELCELQVELQTQLDDLQGLGQKSEALKKSLEVAEKAYRRHAKALSERRQEGAERLSVAVSNAMSGLGMPDGQFIIDVAPLAAEEAAAHGTDAVRYLISANPGQSPMPLAKVASGGELSRMSLAIQVIASDGSAIPTMVFDEVDSGVGGAVAEMVGRRLAELADKRQVLCVTHLPQVASQAHHHLRINKVSDGSSTRTGVRQLSQNERLEEVARMLGGVEVTERTRDHAAEMLATGRDRTQDDVSAAS